MIGHCPSVSTDFVALFAPRSRPQPANPRQATRAGPPPGGPVRSTPESEHSFFPSHFGHLGLRSYGNNVLEYFTIVKSACSISDRMLCSVLTVF
jgi:hypothetical protein